MSQTLKKSGSICSHLVMSDQVLFLLVKDFFVLDDDNFGSLLVLFFNMALEKLHVRHCLLYEFQLGHKPADAYRNLSAVFGDEGPSNATCKRWVKKFDEGDFSLEDEHREGRPVTTNIDLLLQVIEADPFLSTREIAAKIGCCANTAARHLRELGFVGKLGRWIPHSLTAHNKQVRVEICSYLLSIWPQKDFLDRIVTGDEKWILYVNKVRKKQWVQYDENPLPVAKPNLHPKKVMLSVWWDHLGVIYWELLPRNATINSEVYMRQLDDLRKEIRRKRPGRTTVDLLHDNARPHVSKVTREKLQKFHWTVIPHPPYSPDTAPSDFHLFRSLQHFLDGREFDDDNEVQSAINEFFNSRPLSFFQSGINDLVKRWQYVVDSDGEYCPDKFEN